MAQTSASAKCSTDTCRCLRVSRGASYRSEMTQLTTPLGGVMQWTYRSFTYGTNVSLREVQHRYLPMFAGESWSFIHNDSTDETEPFHYWTAMLDSQALAFKIWYFEPNSSFYTVPSGADTIALT